MNIFNVGQEELSDYELKDLQSDNLLWVVYSYESGSYDGDGQAVGLRINDGMLQVKSLGHCSCYGPTEGGMEDGDLVSVEQFLFDKDDIFSHDARKEIKDKVKELVGR